MLGKDGVIEAWESAYFGLAYEVDRNNVTDGMVTEEIPMSLESMRERDKLLSDGEKINRSVLKGPSDLVVTANRLLPSGCNSLHVWRRR